MNRRTGSIFSISLCLLCLLCGCRKEEEPEELFTAVERLREEQAEAGEDETDAEAPRTLILTHSAADGSTTDRIAGELQQQVADLTEGRFEIKIFPNDTLGDISVATNSLASGAVDIRIGMIGSDTAAVSLWLPSLTDLSLEEIRSVLQEGPLRERMEAECEENGFYLMAAFSAHYRMMTSTEPVEEAEDFRQVLMRTISGSDSAEQAYWQALGARTYLVEMQQVNNALQMGIVNSQENTLAITISHSIYQNQKYLIETEHKIYYDSLTFSREFWDSLEPADQELFLQAVDQTASYAIQLEDEEESLDYRILQQNGLEVIGLSDEVRAWLKATGGAAAEEKLRESYGGQWMDQVLAEAVSE